MAVLGLAGSNKGKKELSQKHKKSSKKDNKDERWIMMMEKKN